MELFKIRGLGTANLASAIFIASQAQAVRHNHNGEQNTCRSYCTGVKLPKAQQTDTRQRMCRQGLCAVNHNAANQHLPRLAHKHVHGSLGSAC